MVNAPVEQGRPLTSSQLRRVTADRILRAMKRQSVLTATDLMEATGLSRNAIHKVCGELVGLGLVTETGLSDDASRGPAGRGRPPRMFSFAADAGAIVSVDFGVNTMRACVADLRGNERGRVMRHVDNPDDIDREQILDELLTAVLGAAGVPADRIRVAVVGVPMALSSNVAIHYPAYQRVIDISRRWGRTHGWPVLVENDANLAALGERRFGAARSATDVVVLLAGERLGAGIVTRGTLVRGAHASAGELRFLSLLPGSTPEYVGIGLQARGLARDALADGWATEGLRAAVEADDGHIRISSIFRTAEAGDSSAMSIVRTVSERLAGLIGVLATILDPAMVVISGGVAEAGDLLARTTQGLLPSWMIDNPPRIAMSTLGADAVVAGGISLALDHLDAHLLDDLDVPDRAGGPAA
ncbi:MAG: ROK family protein [Micropruina sp.]|uniref:ROK family transcriptional regulator n=1 Tax=Micropruina sp. TaxID=2737536 RepID=UPI0039E29F75